MTALKNYKTDIGDQDDIQIEEGLLSEYNPLETADNVQIENGLQVWFVDFDNIIREAVVVDLDKTFAMVTGNITVEYKKKSGKIFRFSPELENNKRSFTCLDIFASLKNLITSQEADLLLKKRQLSYEIEETEKRLKYLRKVQVSHKAHIIHKEK